MMFTWSFIVTSSFSGMFQGVFPQDWAALLGRTAGPYASHSLCIQRSVRPRKLDQRADLGIGKPCLTPPVDSMGQLWGWHLDFHPSSWSCEPSLEHPTRRRRQAVSGKLPSSCYRGRFKLAITDNKTELCEARSLVNVYFALNKCQAPELSSLCALCHLILSAAFETEYYNF